MYGVFTYIYHKNQPNVGKYTIHGSYGYMFLEFLSRQFRNLLAQKESQGFLRHPETSHVAGHLFSICFGTFVMLDVENNNRKGFQVLLLLLLLLLWLWLLLFLKTSFSQPLGCDECCDSFIYLLLLP